MRRRPLRLLIVAAVSLLALAAVAAAAPQGDDRTVRTINQTFERANHQAVVFELNVGELEVVGADTRSIGVDLRVRCSRDGRRDRARCEENAKDVSLASSTSGGKLYLEVEGTGLWRSRNAHVAVRLTVPRDLAIELDVGTGELRVSDHAGDLTLDMSVGEATLTNVAGNVRVDMGIGEITVTMPQAVVGEVTLDNGLGETELRHREGRNAMEGILGGTDVHWSAGTGSKTVRVELNVGEIRVRLQ